MSIANKLTELQTDISNAYTAVNTKGGTLPTNKNTNNLASAINSIPSGGGGSVAVGEKDVNFYDYDGTLLHSYTANEFANLTAMPENPSHSGLTSQGWNWDLTDAKTYVASYGKLDIGQMYVTSDNKTRLYITLEEGRLSPTLGLRVNGSVVVDWGDGNTDTMTGTSAGIVVYKTHTYSNAGNYVIALESATTIYFSASASYPEVLSKENAGNNNEHKAYSSCLKKVELGNNVVLNSYTFQNFFNLETITIPKNMTSIGNSVFFICYNLKCIVIPNEMTSISSSCFGYCYGLKHIILPKSITSFSNNCFQYCQSLTRLIVPPLVTQIRNNNFQYCYCLNTIIMPTNITSIGTGAFQSCYSLGEINTRNVTSIEGSAFGSCFSLQKVQISNSLTSFGTYVFQNCYSLCYALIPKTITNIPNGIFSNCYAIKYIDFTNFESVPTLANVGAFTNIGTDAKIVVPDNLYDTWKATNNWSNLASYIIKASEV